MGNPRGQSLLPPSCGRVFCQYLLALLLLALLQAPHLVSSLENLSVNFPPAARLASLLDLTAEASGLSRLGNAISTFLASFSTERKAGALPESPPSRAEAEPPVLPPAEPQPPRQTPPHARLSVSRA